MSEQLRHKMINLEVAPPPTAWENIAARLYDDGKYALISAKLDNFEAAPPPGSWEKISSRIYDDQQYTAVAEKMNDFETIPPPQIWNNVLTALEESKTDLAPVINIRQTIYRIAAAAVVVGIIITAWMISSNKQLKIEVVKNTNSKLDPNSQKSNKASRDNTTQNQQKENVLVQDNQLDYSSQKNNQPSLTADSYDAETAARYATINHSSKMPRAAVTAPPLLDANGNAIESIGVLNTSNYIMVAGPNGQLTRMSVKFESFIRFLNDDGTAESSDDSTKEYVDRVIIESDAWKKRFQEWRTKIKESSYIPSSVNFLDIVELKELIQEKQ